MDRRKFLQTLGALAAAAMVPGAAHTARATVPEVNPEAKYREALRLFDRCVPYASDTPECSRRFDELLGYLKENFPVPEYNHGTLVTTRKILRNTYSIAELRSIPPVVADSMYALSLAKLALREYNFHVYPENLTNFDWLHGSYGRLIYGSTNLPNTV